MQTMKSLNINSSKQEASSMSGEDICFMDDLSMFFQFSIPWNFDLNLRKEPMLN